jgi:hypothetical protein
VSPVRNRRCEGAPRRTEPTAPPAIAASREPAGVEIAGLESDFQSAFERLDMQPGKA